MCVVYPLGVEDGDVGVVVLSAGCGIEWEARGGVGGVEELRGVLVVGECFRDDEVSGVHDAVNAME